MQSYSSFLYIKGVIINQLPIPTMYSLQRKISVLLFIVILTPSYGNEITNYSCLLVGEVEQPPASEFDEAPAFPGGEIALQKFIVDSIVRPKQLVDSGITGRVIVQITINEEGFVENVNVLGSIHPLLSKAALDVINKLPQWEPAKKWLTCKGAI